MFVKYGTFTFDANRVDVTSFTRKVTRNARGFAQTAIRTMQLRVDVIGTGSTTAAMQANLRTQINAIESAFASDGFDIGLYHDDGTLSAHYIKTAECIGGVMVTSLDYPQGNQGKNGEYATGRTVDITLEGEILIASDSLVAWRESLSFIGTGGPRDIHIEVLNGPPQRQTVNQATVQRITQSGGAVGFLAYPVFPGPIFPAAEMQDRREERRDSPQMKNGEFINWPISWSYAMESATPLSGSPNRR